MKAKKLLYQMKNRVKYSLKRKITVDELLYIQRLVEGGYISQKTYNKLFIREWNRS